MRLLIADAIHSYRRFVKQVLESTGDLKVVGEAADGEEVVRLAQQLKPDVALMDIDLPDLDGLEAPRGIKPPSLGQRSSCYRSSMGKPSAKLQRSSAPTPSCSKVPRSRNFSLLSGGGDRPRAIACKGGGACLNFAKIL